MKERKRNRMQDYDYSRDNLYFVTSCTKNRIHYFGEIEDGMMILNEMGEIAEKQWEWLTQQYLYAVSHAFVVMPNHIHGILEINRANIGAATGTNVPAAGGAVDADGVVGAVPVPVVDVGSGRDLTLQKQPEPQREPQPKLPQPQQQNQSPDKPKQPIKIKPLSELMGAYKTTTSKKIHLLGYNEFAWQRSFHDHIIRDSISYDRIKNYIITNPQRWNEDKFNDQIKGVGR